MFFIKYEDYNIDKVIAATAFIIATTAAFFSVSGIGKLFAGAFIAATVMASALELGKLVSISFLYRYWNEIHKTLKLYFIASSIILMCITSLGIYGFLTAAYAKAAQDPLIKSSKITTLESKDSTIMNSLQFKNTRINQLLLFQTQQESRLDATIAKTTTGSSRAVTSTQKAIKTTGAEIHKLQNEIDSLHTLADSLKLQKVTLSVDIETNTAIGTFVYVAKIMNVPLDTLVKWFTAIIVLVFDPLSICLLISYNFLQKKKESVINYTETDGPILDESNVEETNLEKELIVEPSVEIKRTKKESLPYYMDPAFDWNNEALWQNDKDAVKYKTHFTTHP